MMKFLPLTLIAMLLLSNVAFTQPTINADDLTPEFESSVTFAEGSYVNPGPSGADQTWNLSGITSEFVTTTMFVEPDGLPESASFPSANHAAVAVSAGDLILYDYNLINSSVIEEIGHYGTSPDIELHLIYSDARTQVALPLNFNGTFDDTFESEQTIESETSEGTVTTVATEIGTLDAVVDGYGTLTTPAGTFTDVLRVKYDIESTLTTTIDDQPFTSDVTEVEYQYYKAGIPMPLARLTTSTTSFMGTVIDEEETGMYYMNPGGVGFAENETPFSDIQLYPVPARTHIELLLNSETATEAHFSLLSATGKMVHRWSQQSIQAQMNQIRLDLPELAGGTYLLQIQSDGHLHTKRVVVRD